MVPDRTVYIYIYISAIYFIISQALVLFQPRIHLFLLPPPVMNLLEHGSSPTLAGPQPKEPSGLSHEVRPTPPPVTMATADCGSLARFFNIWDSLSQALGDSRPNTRALCSPSSSRRRALGFFCRRWILGDGP